MRRLVFLTLLSFLVVGAVVALSRSITMLISLISMLALAGYFLFSLQSSKSESKLRAAASLNVPGSLVFGLLLIPVILSGFYSLELSKQQPQSSSIYSLIVTFGMSLTFLYSFVNLPLAIYHKKLENTIPESLIKPLVTILVPAYNEEANLKYTLESLIECDYSNKEIMVVDDGSTDRTYDIANSFVNKSNHGRFLVITKKNGGKSSAINYGLQFAKGEIIIVVDADSMVGRDAIKELVKYFQYPELWQ